MPTSLCSHRSRTGWRPLIAMSDQRTVTVCAVAPALVRPTAWVPSKRGRAQTSASPSLATRAGRACPAGPG